MGYHIPVYRRGPSSEDRIAKRRFLSGKSGHSEGPSAPAARAHKPTERSAALSKLQQELQQYGELRIIGQLKSLLHVGSWTGEDMPCEKIDMPVLCAHTDMKPGSHTQRPAHALGQMFQTNHSKAKGVKQTAKVAKGA